MGKVNNFIVGCAAGLAAIYMAVSAIGNTTPAVSAPVPTPSSRVEQYRAILNSNRIDPDKTGIMNVRVELGDTMGDYLVAEGNAPNGKPYFNLVSLEDYARLIKALNPCSGGYTKGNGMLNASYESRGLDGKMVNKVENRVNLPDFNGDGMVAGRDAKSITLEEALICK